MALQDTRAGRDLLRLFSRHDEALAELRAAMAAADPHDGPFMTSRRLLDYSGEPGFAISPRDLPDGCNPSAVAWTLARLERKREQ